MSRQRWAILATVLWMCATPVVGINSAEAAEITHTRLEKTELILIDGEIAYGDEEKFRKLSIIYDDAIVALDSAGGSLVAAIEIGKMIHLKGFPTLVPADAICTSGCALVWVAGSKRFLSPKGRVGFHASYLDVGGKPQETGLGNALVGRYLTLLNLPEKAVVFATSASPTEIEWLNAFNMRDAGIDFEVFKDTPSQAASGPPPLVRTPRATANLGVRRNQSVAVADYGEWTLYRNDERRTCNLLALDSDGEAISVEHDAKRKGASVMFTRKHAFSLADGAKRKLDVPFLDGEKLDNGWIGIEFTARTTVDGSRMLFSQTMEPEFLDDLVEGSVIGFYQGKTLIAAYTLKDTRQAVDALRTCSARTAGIDPRDPFAR